METLAAEDRYVLDVWAGSDGRSRTPASFAGIMGSRRRRCWRPRRPCSWWRGTSSRATGRGATWRRSPRRRPSAASPTGTPSSPCSPAAGIADPAHRDHSAQPSAHRRHAGQLHRATSSHLSRSRRGCARSTFAALVAEWLSDRERARALADFVRRLLPQTLGAIEHSGLRDSLGKRIMTELARVELAPLAAGLLSAVTEKGRHQRLLDELLAAMEKVLGNEETLAAMREKIRKELPALFNLYRADAYLLRKIVASTNAFIQEAAPIAIIRCGSSSTDT